MANFPQSPYIQSYQPPAYGMPVQPQAQQQPASQPTPAIRTVYSEAEARAAQIPIDGSTYIFLDTTNNRIYTKRFDYSNGSFPLAIYQQVQPSAAPEGQYVTMEQFQAWRAEIESMIPKQSSRGGTKNND